MPSLYRNNKSPKHEEQEGCAEFFLVIALISIIYFCVFYRVIICSFYSLVHVHMVFLQCYSSVLWVSFFLAAHMSSSHVGKLKANPKYPAYLFINNLLPVAGLIQGHYHHIARTVLEQLFLSAPECGFCFDLLK